MICPLAHYYTTTRLNPKEIKKNLELIYYIYYLINIRNCWRNRRQPLLYSRRKLLRGFPFSSNSSVDFFNYILEIISASLHTRVAECPTCWRRMFSSTRLFTRLQSTATEQRDSRVLAAPSLSGSIPGGRRVRRRV
jgi:hypothetical protein